MPAVELAALADTFYVNYTPDGRYRGTTITDFKDSYAVKNPQFREHLSLKIRINVLSSMILRTSSAVVTVGVLINPCLHQNHWYSVNAGFVRRHRICSRPALRKLRLV